MTVYRMRRRGVATLMLTALLIAGCATNRVLDQADVEMQRGNVDTAIAYYQQTLLEDPGNTDAKIKLALAKLQASQQHERTGVTLMEAGDYQRAVLELQLAVRLDSANEMALRKLMTARGGARGVRGAGPRLALIRPRSLAEKTRGARSGVAGSGGATVPATARPSAFR